jgi:O-antigen/teichoic acid export membrane protein
MRRSLQLDLLIVAALFVLPLAFFWQVTLGDRTLLPADNLYQFQPWAAYRDQLGVPAVPHNSLLSDLVLENLPWKQFIRDSLANREIPLWNPYIFAGVPFLAAGQHSAMYPFSIIYYVLPLDKAYGWFTVSQLWLAGTLMFLFMRGLGLGRLGAAVAGIAYQLSGFFIASVVFQMIIAAAAWFPFLLLMVEFTIRQRPAFGRPTVIPWIALGALGLGMEILAGHVEFTYYALLVMGFWAACRLGSSLWRHARELRATWRSSLFKPAVSLIALVVLGLAVGSIQFIPTLELAGYNFREGSASFDQVRGYAYPPRHALAFLMPNFYGSPAQHDYLDVFTGQSTAINWQRADGIAVTDTYWEVGKNYVEGACYVGLLTLFLAAIALLNARFEKAPHARIETVGPYRAVLAALALISVTFTFGTITYAILYYGLPGINQLHSPFRWVFPLTLCLSALAGFGAEALQRSRGESTFGAGYWRNGAATSFTFRLARVMGWALIWLGTATLALLTVSRVFFERLRGPIESLFHKLAGADMAFPTVEAFYSYEFRQILLFGLFLVACGIVIRVSRCPIYLPKWLGRGPIWEALALVVLALDLVVASAGFNPAADPAWLKFEPPAITWLKQHNPQEWRFTAVEGPTHTMNANVGWLYGLQDIRGYDSMIPKQYVEYMNQIQPQNQLLYNRIAPIFPDHLEALDSSLLDLLSVKYVVSEIEIDTKAHPKYRQVYQDNAVRIYENTRALPRVFVRSYLIDLSDPGTPITRPLVVEGAVTVTEVSRNQIQVDVLAEGGGHTTRLVVTDSQFPGWRAYIRTQGKPESDEIEWPIEQAYGNLRQITLGAGSWTVRFRYSPPSFQVGAFTTFIALMAILFAVLAWLWRRFYTEEADETHGVRRVAKNSIAPIVLNLFNRLIDFALAAIMLRILGPADAGTYYYAIVIFGWFDTITNFGLNLLLTREVARDRASAGRYLLNSSVLRLVLAGAGVPLLFLFFVLHGWLIKPVEPLAVGAVILLYVGLVPQTISYGLTALFYAFEKAELPAAVTTISAILKAVFSVTALLIGWGVLGLAGASILVNVITLVILGVQARGVLRAASATLPAEHKPGARATVDRALMRDMIFASWPLMLNNLLAGLFFKIDVTILEPAKGSEVVGQYSTAYKWLDALGLIPSLFTMALLPVMSRQAKEDRPALQRSYHFAVKLLVILALPTAVATTFLAHALISILGGARFLPDGAIALQLMVWFIPIGWINSLTNYVLVALDLQRPMRWAFLAGVSFNVIANLIFIPLYSYRAAAIITVLSEVVLQLFFYRLLRRELPAVPWIGLLWKPVVAVLVMAAVLIVLWPLGTVGALAGLMIGGTLYVGVLLALHPFSDWEASRVISLLPGRVRRLARLEASA